MVYCENCEYLYIKDLVCGVCEKHNKVVRPWDFCYDGKEVVADDTADELSNV